MTTIVAEKNAYHIELDVNIPADILEKYTTSQLNENLSKFSVNVLTTIDEAFVIGEIIGEIVSVSDSKYDTMKHLTVYVEIPKIPYLDTNENPAHKLTPIEYEIFINIYEEQKLLNFILYPFEGEDDSRGASELSSIGFKAENNFIQQYRVPCKSILTANGLEHLTQPLTFKIKFKVSDDLLKCTFLDLSTSGYYLNSFSPQNVRTKVKLVPINYPNNNTVAGLISYDKDKKELILEYDDVSYSNIVAGYENEFIGTEQSDIDTLISNKQYVVKNLYGCNDVTLLTFNVLLQQSKFVTTDRDYLLYRNISITSDDKVSYYEVRGQNVVILTQTMTGATTTEPV